MLMSPLYSQRPLATVKRNKYLLKNYFTSKNTLCNFKVTERPIGAISKPKMMMQIESIHFGALATVVMLW